MPWFKKIRKPIAARREKASRVPEGLWVKCPDCAQIIYNKDLTTNLNVCPKCAHHFRLSATERLRTLFDGEWTEFDRNLSSTDPLSFSDTKAYKDRLKASEEATGTKDAVIVGAGTIDGVPALVAAMEYEFIGGSMGVVVGEKITRVIERALETRRPLIVVCCSGGARMMEGALSLMQMAKICGALARLDRAGVPYISILTDPTTGGVTASFAMLGDLNIAERRLSHRLSVHDEPLRQVDQVRGGIPAAAIPLASQRLVDDRRDRSFAVRTGDVNGLEPALGMTERLDEVRHVLQPELDPEELEAGEIRPGILIHYLPREGCRR